MMKKIPYTNETDKYITVGTVTIPPGQTRDVEETLHPDYHAVQVEPVTAPPADLLAALLAGTVAAIVAALPGLTQADLAELVERENASEKPRKTLLDAIAEQQLAKAGESVDSNPAA